LIRNKTIAFSECCFCFYQVHFIEEKKLQSIDFWLDTLI